MSEALFAAIWGNRAGLESEKSDRLELPRQRWRRKQCVLLTEGRPELESGSRLIEIYVNTYRLVDHRKPSGFDALSDQRSVVLDFG